MEQARAVADTILYEGYLLYPYTASSLKNQLRWQFGVLMPHGYIDTSEPRSATTQFLVRPSNKRPRLNVLVRFLQAAADKPRQQEISIDAKLGEGEASYPFGVDVLRGTAVITTERDGKFLRVTLRLQNDGRIWADADRNQAMKGALISAHALITVHGGVCVSLLDPPEEAKDAVARCNNRRTFPVLIGKPGKDNKTATMMLASPIILYDFPKINENSTGHTFDGTEVDELLLLSVASLTDEEKAEARATDERAREIVDRAEAMNAGIQSTLHGTIAIGERVRIHPKRRADAFDMFVEGRTARVRGLHDDVDGRRYVSVVFDDDPASDLHEWYGRSFFYEPDEIEALDCL